MTWVTRSTPRLADQVGDIVLAELGVPAIVHVNGQRPKPELDRLDQHQAAVDTARNANDAIVAPSAAIALHPLDQSVEPAPALGRVGRDIAAMHVLERLAIIADALVIEKDVGRAFVHHASGADARSGIGRASAVVPPPQDVAARAAADGSQSDHRSTFGSSVAARHMPFKSARVPPGATSPPSAAESIAR